jgi:L-iditol 2-dehydrogenase
MAHPAHNRIARYMGQGRVEIVEEPMPACPPGGLLVKTLACGLCSGELMSWYMDRKIPHVLGHEVCAEVVESQDDRFQVGKRVFPHHHAPDVTSPLSKRGAEVHDAQWKATKLVPGGMAEWFGVSAANLSDCLDVSDLRPQEAALIEPLACVVKAANRLRLRGDETVTVIGLGVMGLMFMHLLKGAQGIDLSESRRAWAASQGMRAVSPEEAEKSEVIIVCPGSEAALDLALSLAEPDPRICLFAPMPPDSISGLDLHRLYFQDLSLICSYSCGPKETREAKGLLAKGLFRAEAVVSHFIALDELPESYLAMKEGRILKPMVLFGA